MDTDCDGVIPAEERDQDEDGAVACEPEDWLAEWSAVAGDCDDQSADLNPYDEDADGVSSCEGDCDDQDDSISPNMIEVCDGADNDCDSFIDEDADADGTLWYADSDQDGFGDDDVSQLSCVQPSGYVATGGDCDDSLSIVFPANIEQCDGVDNNCDGVLSDDELDLDGDGYAACPSSSPWYGASNIAVGDCDDSTHLISPRAAGAL